MFDELSKYKQCDHFFFTRVDNLAQVCNAPTDKSGVYIVYALKNGRIELVYIGRSGEVRNDGTLFVRQDGIKGRIVNGKQFGNPRRNSWPQRMAEENIEALDVYWYVTHNDKYVDCPVVLEKRLLQNHFEIHGRRPSWNRR